MLWRLPQEDGAQRWLICDVQIWTWRHIRKRRRATPVKPAKRILVANIWESERFCILCLLGHTSLACIHVQAGTSDVTNADNINTDIILFPMVSKIVLDFETFFSSSLVLGAIYTKLPWTSNFSNANGVPPSKLLSFCTWQALASAFFLFLRENSCS